MELGEDEDEDEGEDVDEEETELEVKIRRNIKAEKAQQAGKTEIVGNVFSMSPGENSTKSRRSINLGKGQKVLSHSNTPSHTQGTAHTPSRTHAHTHLQALSQALSHTQAQSCSQLPVLSQAPPHPPHTMVANSASVPVLPPVAAPVFSGLDGVVATQTRLSLVDGLNGVLVIGGYPVEEIAGYLSVEEAALLLWTDSVPSAATSRAMRKELVDLSSLRSETLDIIRTARDAPPIDALRMACATLSLGLSNPNDITPANDLALAKVLLGSFPTIVAAHSRLRQGLEPIAPRADLSLAANLLYMTFGVEPDPAAVKALDTYWVCVCDHGMNASTFTARVIASTRSDMVSAVTGAVGALKGPLHGGAPGPVLDMLVEMKTAEAAEPWLRKELGAGRRIMGFGHRIYKVRDPRAEVLAKAAEEMGGASLQNSELYKLARTVEKTALRVLDELKPGRNLKTNVEFYTALVLQSLGLKPDQFVALFACGRVVGWCAHVIEQHQQDRLLRPQSQYIGPRRSCLWSKPAEVKEKEKENKEV